MVPCCAVYLSHTTKEPCSAYMAHLSSPVKLSPPSFKRNAEIELFRFFSAVAVVLFHLHICSGGLLAVDFFFILSGALMTRSVVFSKKAGQEVKLTPFLWKKLKSFYPELLAAVIIGMSAAFLKDDFSSYLHRCYYSLMNEVLLLRMTALSSDPTMGGCPQSWYLSSMMVGMVLVFPIVKYLRQPVVMLVAGFLVSGYLVQRAGGLQESSYCDWYGITYSGNIRAVGDLLLGSASLYAAEYLKRCNFSDALRIALTAVKYFAVLGTLLMYSVRYRLTEPFILLLCMCIVCSCLADKTLGFYNEKWAKICIFLGKMSLPIYLAHWPIVRVLPKLEGVAVLRESYMVYPACFLILSALVCTVHLSACAMRKLGEKGCS